ncbi:hypothetical protein ACIOG7_10470 [Streptomyces sp. NPDC087894]|uniref:hypothetical protein n=1 Tax=Streptomyces sp. NPDC087894 TaxID=3365816 RepID=UPI003829E1B3
MTTDQLTTWAVDHPWPTAGIAAAVLLVVLGTMRALVNGLRRAQLPPAAVLAAAIAAAGCTAYSADTSWNFAADHLDMADATERAWLFAAGEMALLGTALMARQNLRTTGAPGVPGVLVWVITGVQIIPAYAESGFVGGTVRAFFGPICAALLWHLAMGLEVRVVRPDALSSGLPAMIGRELRERLLSRLGLAARNRTAEQITRDRATVRAVRLAALLELQPTGRRAASRRRRLASAVARSGAGTDGEQRHQLLQLLAARRTSGQLATLDLASPWTGTPVPEAGYPRTPLGVTGAQLRAMDPFEVVRLVHSAHPEAEPSALAALCTEYGVPVSETQVLMALRPARRQLFADAVVPPALEAAAEVPEQVPAEVPAPDLVLDLVSTPEVHPEVCHRVPVFAAAPRAPRIDVRIPVEDEHAAVPDPEVPGVPEVPATDEVPVPEVPEVPDDEVPKGDRDVPDPDPLIEQVRADHGAKVPGIKALKRQYGVGQPRAQLIRDALTQGTNAA